MKDMIRWVGFPLFIALFTALFACVYFFAEPILKSTIESQGSEFAGAKVELRDLELSWSPAGITLMGLQVSDADNPMQNLFELERATATIELERLLFSQVLIDELVIESLQLGSPRKTSGAISHSKNIDNESTSTTQEHLENIKTKLPSVDDVLAKEPLLTVEAQQALKDSYTNYKERWTKIQSQLPTQEDLDTHKKAFSDLQNKKFNSAAEYEEGHRELRSLKDALKNDRKALAEAKIFIVESQKDMTLRTKNLAQAPQKDWENLSEKYSLDQGGALNMSKLLLGDTYSKYTEDALAWYTKLKPYLQGSNEDAKEEASAAERGEGTFFHFSQENPVPDFLIRKTALSIITEHGSVEGEITNITHQHDIIGKPTHAKFHSTTAFNADDFQLDATIDHRNQQQKESVNFLLKGLDVKSLNLSDSDTMSASLDTAKALIKGNFTFDQGRLAGLVNMQFDATKISANGKSQLAQEISKTLENINSFDLEAKMSGSLKDIDTAIRSNLDTQVGAAFTQRLSAKQEEWSNDLKAGLNSKLQSYAKENDALAQLLGNEDSKLDLQLADADELLKSSLKSFTDESLDKAKDKLKNKLNNLFD
ncbi:MAG: hypothetical protein ACI93R_000912 [Flavobacteriales bacterium]|jgi:uncharacterized protein (TIGR03545 family)